MKLFISYAHDDKLLCKEIVDYLSDIHELWYDKRLMGGQDWWSEIQNRLLWCDCFIFLLSHASVQSIYCQQECGIALALQKPILPVVIQGRTPIPDNLIRFQYVDLSNDIKNITALLNALTFTERNLRPSHNQNHFVPPVTDNPFSPLIKKSEAPRKIDIDNLLPGPLEWCVIKGGGYIDIKHGQWEKKRQKTGLFSSEEGWGYQTVYIEPVRVLDFAITKYLISERQFEVFSNAPDGYKNKASWIDKQYDGVVSVFPTSTRTWINFWEAQAFCRWLNMKINFGSWELFLASNGGGQTYGLPTEAQWQRAVEFAGKKLDRLGGLEWTSSRPKKSIRDTYDFSVEHFLSNSPVIVRGGDEPLPWGAISPELSRNAVNADERKGGLGFRLVKIL